ncbi:MAG: LysM peptidoglycan-binding domain-containing protein [Anaerolineae bacterium]
MGKMSIRALALLVLIVFVSSMVVQAQDSPLVNGGLEEGSFGQYTGRRGGEFPIYLPGGWNYWFAAPSGDRINNGSRTSIQPHPGPGPSPYEGQRALNISCGYFTCTTAIYQQVGNIQAGSNIGASAWSQVKACNLGGGTSCGSSPASGAQTRIGLDPTGGADPNNPAVVWSAWVTPHDQWLQQSVSVTATGSTVTVFLYSTQGNIADLNKTYWDAVVMSGAIVAAGAAQTPGAPTATLAPTAPPYVAFVVPQGEQPDGSIVHTIQQGDTLDSIAYAYGITRTELMQLNNLQSANFIFPGQKLIVKPPTQAAAASEATDEAGGENTPPQSTEEATVASEQVASVPTNVPATEVQPTAPPPTAEQPVEQPTEAQPTTPPEPTTPPPTAPVVVANAAELNPAATTAQVCVLLFEDANQNRLQEAGEGLLGGGDIALLKGAEQAGTYTTDGAGEPHCFEGLAAGDYVAAASAPSGYGLTTPDQLRVQLNPGATINLTFGAAQGVQAVQPPTADAGAVVVPTPVEEVAQPLTDQLLSISGLVVFGLAALVLVGGLGLAIVLRRR